MQRFIFVKYIKFITQRIIPQYIEKNCQDVGDNFTQEYKSNEFCDSKEWDFNVEANSQGPLIMEFIFNNVPENLYIEIIEEEMTEVISNNSIIETTLQSNTPKEFLIKVSVN